MNYCDITINETIIFYKIIERKCQKMSIGTRGTS